MPTLTARAYLPGSLSLSTSVALLT